MRLFAIGDMHLAGGTNKTMDRFGEKWREHDRKIFDAWERIGCEKDLLIIAGDTSWAMRLEQAMPDLDRIGRMKGTKILIKGNHDYWWETVTKLNRALDPSIKALNASAFIFNRIAIAGTRGWTCPNDTLFRDQDGKIYEREVARLNSALSSVAHRRVDFDALIVALHYPPVNDKHERSGFIELMEKYEVNACVYGHLHGEAIPGALSGLRQGTVYHLVSADAVDFVPREVNFSYESTSVESRNS